MLYNEKLYEFLKAYEGGPFSASQSRAGNWLQYTLHKVELGCVQIKLTVRDELCNPWAQMHGGIFALIMDEAVGLSFFTVCNNEHYTTSNLHVEHLKSAPLQEVLIAEGKVIKHGRKVAYIEGTIYNSKMEIICRATSNLINTGNLIFDNNNAIQ
jgi:acyl-coenzyme A thioesterase 13